MSDELTIRIEEELRRLPARAALVFQRLDGPRDDWRLRPDEPFPAASVIKVPILLEVFRQAQEGALDLEETREVRPEDRVGGAGVLREMHGGLPVTLRDLARLMIVVSDNVASNMLLDRVGFEAVNGLMRALGMLSSVLNRKFMHPPDPGDNVTSAGDMAACLQALWEGSVLRGEWQEEALGILRRQQFREKIPMMLPPTAVVANKTGELEGVRHDGALVEDGGRAWILVALTREGRDPWDVDYRIACISRWCHKHATEDESGG